MSEAQIDAAAITYAAQTALVTFFVWTGVLLMWFAQPPIRWFAGGSPYRGSRLVVLAALGLIAGYYVILLVPALREFFELVPIPWQFHAMIILATLLWIVLQRWVYRKALLERFLDMPPVLEADGESGIEAEGKPRTSAAPQAAA
jgi:cation-transporting ATPase E